MAALPAAWVSRGYGIPDVCSRHGQPATYRRRIVIESSPPGWTYATIPAGLLIFGILRAVFRKAIVAPAWPFCDRCRRRRIIAIAIAGGIVAAGLATIVAGFQSTDTDVIFAVFCAGLLVILLGYAGLHWARPAAIADAQLTRDGQFVTLSHASQRFTAQLTAGRDVVYEHN